MSCASTSRTWRVTTLGFHSSQIRVEEQILALENSNHPFGVIEILRQCEDERFIFYSKRATREALTERIFRLTSSCIAGLLGYLTFHIRIAMKTDAWFLLLDNHPGMNWYNFFTWAWWSHLRKKAFIPKWWIDAIPRIAFLTLESRRTHFEGNRSSEYLKMHISA